MSRILRAKNSTEILDHSPDFSRQVMARLDGRACAPRERGGSAAERRAVVAELAEEQNGRCYYCGVAMVANPQTPQDPRGLTFDHIKPRSEGGRFTRDNGVAACNSCNGKRGNMPFELFRKIARET